MAQSGPESSIELDQISVTATRTPTQVLDVPGTVTVIPRKELDDRITRDTQDLVRYQPGVTVNRQTSGTDPAGNFGGFTIRGVGGNRVQVQVDGSRVIERITDGTRDFVDLPFVSGVEIVRGPGSVLWGADALGGIVSYHLLDPDEVLKGRPQAARLDTSFDSFDQSFTKTAIGALQLGPYLQAIAGISHRSADEANLSRARADGGRWGCPVPTLRFLPCDRLNPVDVTAWNAYGKVVLTPGHGHRFTLTGEYFDRETDINQLYDFNVVSSGLRNGAYFREQILSRQRLALSHEWQVGLPFLDEVKWTLSHSPQEREFNGNRLQTQVANRQVRNTRSFLEYTEVFSQADLQAKTSFALGPTRHLLTYGFQGDFTTTDYERKDIVRNLATGVTTTTIAGGFNFANADTTRADGYIQDEIKILDGRWTITPGLRYATYEIEPRPGPGYVIVPGKEPRKLEAHKLIPQVGTIFDLDETYSVYARYAEGFKMPTSQQLFTSLPFGTRNLVPNPDLRPESVRSYEAGVRARFADGFISLGAFHADYKDFIQELYEVPGSTDITSRNLARVELSGIEASAEWQFNATWRGTLALNYQYGDQRTTPTAQVVPYNQTSPLTAVAGLAWRLPEYKLEGEIIGTFAAGANRASAPTIFKPGGYSVFDAYVSWRPTPNFTLRAGVQNIFDRRYFAGVFNYDRTPASASVAAVNPLELQTAPGRTFKLSATAEF